MSPEEAEVDPERRFTLIPIDPSMSLDEMTNAVVAGLAAMGVEVEDDRQDPDMRADVHIHSKTDASNATS